MDQAHLPSAPLPYRRIVVIGCPGSGKSTFSRALRNCTELPLYHLDAIYWREDRTTLQREEFRTVLRHIVEADCWIIDGHYASTWEMRIQACDAVFFLDYPPEVCIEGVRARRGQTRSDIPWVETEDDSEFLEFIGKFQEESKPRVLELLEKYPEKPVFRFSCRAEAEEFLRECNFSAK